MVMLRTVLYEILGALEFAGFLATLGAACVWISRMPWYRRLREKLCPKVSEDG